MPSKGIVYYTDGRLDSDIHNTVRRQLRRCVNLKDISNVVSVTLSDPDWDFGKWIKLDKERGYLTMFKQILAGLEAVNTDITYFCEHDVLYHPTHFDFTPTPTSYWYNTHVYKVSAQTGQALTYTCAQTSGLSAETELLLTHYRKRVQLVEEHGFSRKMGFEPGTHGRAERVDDIKAQFWRSDIPLVDVRHTKNLTETRWKKEQFRNQRFTEGWLESDSVPGWGNTLGRFNDFLKDIRCSNE